MIADCWPPGLRAGWQRLTAHRERLLDAMEALPRVLCHLDAWVSNVVRRPGGTFVLLDWAFSGDGALGEDLGNWIPDAALDLFWPATRLAELEHRCADAYLHGLRNAGWTGSDRDVRLAVTASCVKYSWLVPLMLARASEAQQQAYHRPADARVLYSQRGIVLAHLVGWCDEALALLA